MSPQREEALNSTGFNWGEERQDPDELWNARLHEFATFLAEHGHGRVPSGWAPNPALGKWVDRQRQLRRACRLRPDRQAALEREGFDWGAGPQPNSEQLWLQRMAELAEYRSRYGNCVVPQRWTENQALGRWVAKQRRRRWELPEERRERLDALGFEWSAK